MAAQPGPLARAQALIGELAVRATLEVNQGDVHGPAAEVMASFVAFSFGGDVNGHQRQVAVADVVLLPARSPDLRRAPGVCTASRTRGHQGGSVACTLLVVRLGNKLVVTSGLVSLALAYGWISTSGATTPYAEIAAQMVLLGLGMGLTSVPATESIMGAVQSDTAGVGSASTTPPVRSATRSGPPRSAASSPRSTPRRWLTVGPRCPAV